MAESIRGHAKDAYSSAKILLRNGDFAGAATKFEQAYELSKDPRLLFDMAICEKNMHAYARMQRLLEQYLAESPSISLEQRSAVTDALAAAKSLVGALTLSANVDGASVSIDGDSVGQTPLTSPILLDLGKHRVEVAKEGFVAFSREIEVRGGGEQALPITLVKEVHTSQLLVIAEDSATIRLDGKIVATARFEGAVPAGPHDIRITQRGKLPYETQVELHARETRTVQVTLPNEPQSAPMWPWIVGGVAVAAGAAIGGYFLLKPQDTTTPVPASTLGGGTVRFAVAAGL